MKINTINHMYKYVILQTYNYPSCDHLSTIFFYQVNKIDMLKICDNFQLIKKLLQ